ncbi:hypothetical protein RHMOL_Rhmol09G0130500 [Rhododendron molle]|uniref:Uncharacterized protein n=1 Tax=Rhododendron molle TaxID=49168 RepID=A0ACC0MCT3_RHOML|nr:hypothetical protein RHMOL_Rhmol09G0130500 [Rhododendron molle]
MFSLGSSHSTWSTASGGRTQWSAGVPTPPAPRGGRVASDPKDEWSSACRPDAARESRERGEDEEEEQEDGGEEGGGDEVEEAPLAGVAFEGGEAQVAHFL